jgi:hypothetical protein
MNIRKAAVAGTWYPGTAAALAAAVDGYLAGIGGEAAGHLTELVADCSACGTDVFRPRGGYAYRQLRGRSVGLVVLVGPSHFLGFEGVSIYRAEVLRHRSASPASTRVRASAIMAARRSCTSAAARPRALARNAASVSDALAPAARIVLSSWGGRRPTRAALGDALGAVLRAAARSWWPAPIYRTTTTRPRRRADGVVIDHVSR